MNIPGHGWDKINSAFAYGGPSLLAQTVEQDTGLRLDHYAEIGFAGFGQVVDALGGCGSVPPIRSTTHWPGSIWRPGARSWTEPRHSATSGPAPHRVRTWTGWFTSGSSCRRC